MTTIEEFITRILREGLKSKNEIYHVFDLIYKMYNQNKNENYVQGMEKLYNGNTKQFISDFVNMLRKQPDQTSSFEPYSSGASFPQLPKEGHLMVSGDTGSGKTTTFIMCIYKNLIVVPKNIYIFMTSMSYKKDIDEFCFAFVDNYRTNFTASKDNQPPIVRVYLDTVSECKEMINDIKQSADDDGILAIFEDALVADKKIIENDISGFMLGAKNKNCQVVLFNHNLGRNTNVMTSIKFYLLCNPSKLEFNLVVIGERKRKEAEDPRYDIVKTNYPTNKFQMLINKTTNMIGSPYGDCPVIKVFPNS
jgi:hypothetical protein